MKYYNGYYKIGDKIVDKKFFAVIEATKTKQPVDWIYHNNAFESACKKFRSYDISLEEIYKNRALQLRDQYDYIILNYSGGSDSHNILQTFIKNNIKLDMIFIQWPMSLVDKGLYNPNTIDKTNFNFHSEWDFVLKKDLEWLAFNHPEIKIEIADWTGNVTDNFYKDDLFFNNVTNLPSIARAQKQCTFSKQESKLADRGFKVASIYGVDKPQVGIKNNNVYFRMADNTCMAQPNPDNPEGLEYFYFTPNFPEIPILQAYKLYQYYKINPKACYMMIPREERVKNFPGTADDNWYKDYSTYAELFKLVCYPYWNFSRFQADKPFSITDGLSMGVRAWDNILVKGLSNFDRTQQKWEYLWKSYQTEIDDKFLFSKDTVKAIYTKWHKVPLS